MYPLARSRRGEGIWPAQQPDNQRDLPSGGVKSFNNSCFYTSDMINEALHSGAVLSHLEPRDAKSRSNDIMTMKKTSEDIYMAEPEQHQIQHVDEY